MTTVYAPIECIDLLIPEAMSYNESFWKQKYTADI